MFGIILLCFAGYRAAAASASEGCAPHSEHGAADTDDGIWLMQMRRSTETLWEESDFAAWVAARDSQGAQVAGEAETDDLENRPLSVSVYSASYHGDFGPFHAGDVGARTGCPYSCTFLGHNQTPADVMMVSTQDYDEPRFPKRDGQVWIGHHWEAPAHYQQILREDYMSKFDYTASYRADSTIPIYGMMWDTAGNWSSMLGRQPKYSFAEKNQQEHLMSVWISNCFIDQAMRLPLLGALRASGLSVASYGKCRHNAEVSKEAKAAREAGGGGAEKMSEAAKYLFLYAAENARCPHYHTEKIYHAFVAGTVPVYVGDATIKDWAPKGSYINADDFETAEDLTKYLKKVASNETLYNSYLAWRWQPLPSWLDTKVRAAQRLGTDAWRCDVCRFLRRRPAAQAHAERCHEPRIRLPPSLLQLEQPTEAALEAWKRGREEEARRAAGK